MVNIGGSHSSAGGSACGGLVYRSNGSFVHNFYYKLGAGNALWAELWGLRLGIKLAKQIGLSWVIFEMDSQVVVDLIKSGGSTLAYLSPLLQEQEVISLLCEPCWQASVTHVYLEANWCAE